MSEFLSVPREPQYYSNNQKLADAILNLLPEPIEKPTGHNDIASVHFALPERELYLYMIGFNLSGDPEAKQPVGLEVRNPVSEFAGSVESYTLSPEWGRKSDRYNASSSVAEYRLNDDGEIIDLVPTMGREALKSLEASRIFAKRKDRPSRKEHKAARNLLQIALDDERTDRLLGYLRAK